MRLFKSCFSAVVLCAIYWQDSGAESNSTNIVVESTKPQNPKENQVNKLPVSPPLEFVSIKKLVPRNSTDSKRQKESAKNFTFGIWPDSKDPAGDSALRPNADRKREVENGTFDPFKPLFLFPILPFLLPPKDDNLFPSDTTELPETKNNSFSGSKPFIFLDFAFNIRQIPLKNETEHVNDSKIINVKKLSAGKAGLKKKTRKRRNTKKSAPDFFDDTPLFPDSELDEFLPKPDLFFPDLSFHPKPAKKLSRRKRDEKKPDVKNDLKFFRDAFDEAFSWTKKELERTDPILNFIKAMESNFGEEKKDTDDFFGHFPDEPDSSNMKWKIQKNVKRSNDDRPNDLAKSPESPMIIVDKFVKIGEFRLHDDKFHGKKPDKKGRDADPKWKSLEDGRGDENTNGKNIVEMLKKTKTWKRNAKKEGETFATTEADKMELLPSVDTSYVSVRNNNTIETENEEPKPVRNDTDKTVEFKNLLKVITSIKNTFKSDFVRGEEKFKRKTALSEAEKHAGKKASYDDLKKNISEVLSQFLTLVRKEDIADLTENPQEGMQDQDDFGWSEKELLDSLGTRHKKEAEFPSEYVDTGKSERKVADMNFLFLTVTLPTVLVFSFVLLVCFFSLRVKGKICRKLFSPRQVYVMDDEFSCANKPLKKGMKAENI